MLILIAHLFSLQVIRGGEFKTRAREVARRVLPIPAQRGEIFDRHYDIPLVVNQDSFAVDLIPAEVPGAERPELFEKLSRVLRLPVAEIEKRIPPSYYHLYQPVEVKSGVEFETITYLAEHLEDFKGVTWHNKPMRNYLETGSLVHVIGYIGDITREEIQVLYNRGYSFGAVLGKSGIEKQYDELLRGKDGKRFRVVDVREKHLTQHLEEEIPPEPGKNLVLTIDRNLQRLCEKALGQRVGSVVVLRPANGEILALVSYPSYDPNIFFTDKASEIFNQLSLDPSFPFINRAVQAAYPPASTFKVVMSTALVEEEVFPITRTVECTGKIEYGDRQFYCWQPKTGHGRMDLFSGLAQSCDVYFYTLGDALGVERIAYYAREFGLGHVTGIDLPGERSGFVPTPEWKEKVRHIKWLGGDTLNLSIGQGYLTVSPLQMANMVAMVVNEGKVYRPHVLKEVRDPVTGEIIRSNEAELIHTSHIRKETFKVVQEAMRGVITEGTAKVVITTAAVEIAGKTGTAEVGLEEQWHSWFVAYAPYRTDHPDERVVVVVMVEAENEWEWWAPKASDVILQGIFAQQTYEEAVETLKPWWYMQQLQEQAPEAQTAGQLTDRQSGQEQITLGQQSGEAAR
ncbi:Peptidoglycan D,D-transpeptidase MrdA [subsurface metagenome]